MNDWISWSRAEGWVLIQDTTSATRWHTYLRENPVEKPGEPHAEAWPNGNITATAVLDRSKLPDRLLVKEWDDQGQSACFAYLRKT